MWYSQGSISATSNNTEINGVGTAFLQGCPMDINELQDRFVQLRFNEIKEEHEELDDESN